MTTELEQISCSEAEKASNEGVEGSQIVFLKNISNLFVLILLDSILKNTKKLIFKKGIYIK